MESVIAIPLFLVLLGGTMWIGDLILAKQKLVIADRYAAWNAGNRHRPEKAGIGGEIQEICFNPLRVGQQSVQNVVYEAGPLTEWSASFGATVWLRAQMPEWTRGWLLSGVAWGGMPGPQSTVLYAGRDQETSGDSSHHAVAMRTVYGTLAHRTWKPRILADRSRPWDEFVWNEKWPSIARLAVTTPEALEQDPIQPFAPPGYEHLRHAQYENWSR